MPTNLDPMERDLLDTVRAAAASMPVAYDGAAGVRRAIERGGRSRHRRNALLAVVAGCIVVALGGTAVAREIVDTTTDDFSRLHPDKSQIASSAVEPHTLAGTVTLRNGVEVRLYVTTANAIGSCVDVQMIATNGDNIGSVGFCRGAAEADLQVINGGIVGYIPAADVTTVRILGPSGDSTAPVTHHYYLLSPDVYPPGSSVQVTEYDAAGTAVGKLTLAVKQAGSRPDVRRS